MKWLHNEITLAKLQDGSLTVLLEHFLHLLCPTHYHTILAETSNAWKLIWEHPITLNTILNNIENAGVANLHIYPASLTSPPTKHLDSPIASFPDHTITTYNDSFHPTAAYTNNTKIPYNKTLRNHSATQHHSYAKHTKIPTLITSTSSKCRLCSNQHPNPWNTTANCPFKDPTFIQNKLIREKVTQQNTLYRKINENYNKNLDTPTHQHKPLKATMLDQMPNGAQVRPCKCYNF